MSGLAGLRELKKQQTRDALIRAAHELFVSRGYETTTVEEIASAVDVSERTFFRYFAGKEDVVFALQETVEELFLTLLRNRPAHEPPLAALRATLEQVLERVGESVAAVIPIDLHLRMWQLIETTPALIAVQSWRSLETEEQLARAIAERAGTSVEDDQRPRVLVGAFFGVLRIAMQQWGQSEDATVTGAMRQARSFLDHIPSVFEPGWAPQTQVSPTS
ncbi:TetR family transcriptional regulator [Streptomyces tardus]|uniref:TetR family transcriptional regulator n=1 Tax=Streptomyces tardus TaxID=2780544 RepID=UPI0027E4DD6A|nr:TetR family transcriptional regulator [Streptomyces tardus]